MMENGGEVPALEPGKGETGMRHPLLLTWRDLWRSDGVMNAIVRGWLG